MLEHRWQSVYGWFNFADVYSRIVREAPVGATLVELGVYHGKSLCYLAVEATNSGKNLRLWGYDQFPLCHEIWKAVRQETMEAAKRLFPCKIHVSLQQVARLNLHMTGAAACVWLEKQDAVAAAADWKDNTIFFVWVDLDHLEFSTLQQMEAWWPKIQSGGYLGGHDFDNPDFPGVRKAAEAFAAHHGVTIEVMPPLSFLIRKP